MYAHRVIYKPDHNDKLIMKSEPIEIARKLLQMANHHFCMVDLKYKGRMVTAFPEHDSSILEDEAHSLVTLMKDRGMLD